MWWTKSGTWRATFGSSGEKAGSAKPEARWAQWCRHEIRRDRPIRRQEPGHCTSLRTSSISKISSATERPRPTRNCPAEVMKMEFAALRAADARNRPSWIPMGRRMRRNFLLWRRKRSSSVPKRCNSSIRDCMGKCGDFFGRTRRAIQATRPPGEWVREYQPPRRRRPLDWVCEVARRGFLSVVRSPATKRYPWDPRSRGIRLFSLATNATCRQRASHRSHREGLPRAVTMQLCSRRVSGCDAPVEDKRLQPELLQRPADPYAQSKQPFCLFEWMRT